MTSETSSLSAYEATPRGLLLKLYPRWSGTITRNPASASGSACLRHPYQNSGKPWRRMATGPSLGPAATACSAMPAFAKTIFSRRVCTKRESNMRKQDSPRFDRFRAGPSLERRPRELAPSESRRARSGGPHLGGVHAETQMREVGLRERHQAGVEIAPHEQQQEGHRHVVLVGDGVHHGQRKVNPQRNFCVRNPAGFVLIRFLRERAFLALNAEFRCACKFAFLSNECFDHRLGVAHGNADARGHHKWQVRKRAPPGFGPQFFLRHQVKARNRACRREKERQVDEQ